MGACRSFRRKSEGVRIAVALGLAILLGNSMPSRALGQEGATVRLHAAGSLKAAMTDIAKAFTAASGITVATVFSSSGLLRERFEKGEAGDVFASADMGNPLKLARDGKAGPVVLFARNRLCAVLRPGLSLTSDTLLAAMLDPKIKLGTSTPHADPSGDYAWEIFRKADALQPGNRAKLEAKALQLTGGPTSVPAPADISPYAWHLKEGRADLFLAYCTGGREIEAQLPGASTIALLAALATGADYGLTVLTSSDSARAGKLALFILSTEGQKILAGYGFDAPLTPSP
jgi:ABC-type molybdate transport system substrate-binding protein